MVCLFAFGFAIVSSRLIMNKIGLILQFQLQCVTIRLIFTHYFFTWWASWFDPHPLYFSSILGSQGSVTFATSKNGWNRKWSMGVTECSWCGSAPAEGKDTFLWNIYPAVRLENVSFSTRKGTVRIHNKATYLDKSLAHDRLKNVKQFNCPLMMERCGLWESSMSFIFQNNVSTS